MDTLFEGRESDSPYIEMIWRGQAGSNYAPVCPAKSCWNMLFQRQDEKVRISIEGPLTKATPKTHIEGTEWLVIEFQPGIFLSSLSLKNLLDADEVLPLAARQSFWFDGSTWQLPDYENVETFVNRLVREGALLSDPVVKAILQHQPHELSLRTVRRHFLHATGLTYTSIEQIKRARQAMTLLERGVPILDVVEQAGYTDQPHMTRALKHFTGQTPGQIARARDIKEQG